MLLAYTPKKREFMMVSIMPKDEKVPLKIGSHVSPDVFTGPDPVSPRTPGPSPMAGLKP